MMMDELEALQYIARPRINDLDQGDFYRSLQFRDTSQTSVDIYINSHVFGEH